jgi:membrane-associated protein
MALDKIVLGGGYLAIGLTIFAESGLLIGFFLPGDTLLFGAGILAAQGVFNLPLLISVIVASAIIGDNVGYSIGRRFGPRLFKKQDGAIFKQEYLQRAEAFYEKHGGKTIIMARFVPIVRTFAPMVAGASKMPRGKFLTYNIVGGLLWGVTLPLVGYYIGSKIPWIEHYIEPVILGVIILSVGPAIIHLLRQDNFRAAAKTKLRRAWHAVTGRA